MRVSTDKNKGVTNNDNDFATELMTEFTSKKMQVVTH